MPMQYGGGNKVAGMPNMNKLRGGAAAVPGGNNGAGNAGSTRLGGSSNVPTTRVVGGASIAAPGTSRKKAQPFNAARQKGLAVALRARSARGIALPGTNNQLRDEPGVSG